jgi:class 3 adenylate cyclase/tetratricopeptide (TPR) repeat protein
MNRRMVPDFILQKTRAREYIGSFHAWVLHIDLEDFTGLSTTLTQESERGAEKLSDIINSIFSPAVESIEQHGGFISRFAGDAFIAIFPNHKPDTALHAFTAACAIRDIVQNTAAVDTTCRIGMAKGVVKWQILPNPKKHLFWLNSSAIKEAIDLQEAAKTGQILVNSKRLGKLAAQELIAEEAGSGIALIHAVRRHVPCLKTAICRMSQKSFISHDILLGKSEGEFREVLSVFINFRGADHAALNALIELSSKYGAYLNKVFNSANGLIALVLLGAPTAYEDIVLRGFRFAHELRVLLGNRIRIGMSLGIDYAGFIGSKKMCEYTALGLSVNLSARLCHLGKWGDICFEEALLSPSAQYLRFRSMDPGLIKGFSAPLKCYSFDGLLEDYDTGYLSPFMGREMELQELKEHGNAAFAGEHPSLFALYGEPGSGKSRLVYEYCESVKPARQCFILQCDGILKSSLHPFVFFIKKQFNGLKSGSLEQRRLNFRRRYLGFVRMISPRLNDAQRAELKRMESILAGLISLDWEGSLFRELSGANKAGAMQKAVIQLFEFYALHLPTVLVVEDAQWLDEDSAGLLGALVKALKNSRIQVLATARYNDDGSFPEPFGDEQHTMLKLKSWDEIQIKAFAAALFKQPVSEALASYLKDKTLGNLLHVEQICAHLQANRLLETIDGLLYLKDTGVQISSGINSMLVARIDRLDKSMKDAVQAASVLGNEFTAEVLQELLIRSQSFSNELSDPAEILENGRKSRLWNMLNEVSYSFSHGLLRDTAYEMQLGKHLAKLHRLAAEIMVDYWQGDQSKHAEIAAHFERGELPDKAFEHYQQAGLWARDLYQQHESLEYLNKALEILRIHSPDNEHAQADTLMEIGILFTNFGKYDLAMGYLKQSEKLYLRSNGSESCQISSCYGNKGRVLKAIGDYDAAIEYLNRNLDILLKTKGAEHEYVATTLINLGDCYNLKGDVEKGIELTQQGLTLRESILGKDHYLIGDSLINLACMYADKADFVKAKMHIDAAINIMENTADSHYLSKTIMYNNAGRIYTNLGESEIGMAYYEESIRQGNEGLGPRHPDTMVSMFNIASSCLDGEQYGKAHQFLEEVRDVWQESLGEGHPWLALCYNSLGKAETGLGNPQKGLELCLRALRDIHAKLGKEHPWCEAVEENIAWTKEFLNTSGEEA